MSFNPSSPTTVGVEWWPAVESVTPLTTTTDCVAWTVVSSAAETVDEVYVAHTWTGPSSGYGKLLLDIYDLADTGAGSSPTSTRYAPNVTQSNNNMFAPSGASWSSVTTTSHTYVDDGATYNDTDYLAFANTSKARFEFGSAGHTGAVSSVTFEIRAMGYSGGTPRASVQLYYNGTRVSTLGTLAPPADSDDAGPNFQNFRTYTFGPYTTNPRTGVAWTAADITSFDTGSGHALHLENVSGLVSVSWISMVVSAGTDKRVATGSTATQTTLPSGVQTNLPVTLTANWSKATSTTYLFVARRADDPTGSAQALVPQIVYLADDDCPHAQGVTYSTTIDSSGFVSANGSANTARTVPFWLARTDNAMSADSQPYFSLIAEPCHTSSTLQQSFLGTAATYKGCRVLVGYDGTPSADLTLKVKRTSDNVQMGGTATITTAVVDAADYYGTVDDIDLYLVAIDLASSATLTAASYYFEFASSAASTAPWYVLLLDATPAHALTGNQTYGGSTYQSTAPGDDALRDFAAAISTSPTAPSSITVTKTTGSINGVSIDYAAISWVNGGALGASFERWDLQRSEDGGTTYATIATISTEATVTFDDYESERGTAVKYRVRQVRTDHSASDWTTQSGTITPAASSGAWAVFTTNAAPSVTVGYTPHGTTQTVEFPGSSEVTFVPLHDQDYVASFRPLEDRGISWSFTLQVHTSQSTPSAGPGTQVFDLLRACADASGSICLHTADGERFFGTLVVSKGVRDFGANFYQAECMFRQTSAVASVVAL